MKLLLILLCLSTASFASTDLVTCEQWNTAYKKFEKLPNKAEVLGLKDVKKFHAVYRSIASILGSQEMNQFINDELEKSGYGEANDHLLMLYYRGGFPEEFVLTLKKFEKAQDLSKESYRIDLKAQDMITKLRTNFCK